VLPVLEGLIVLEREGWVTIEIHRGTYSNALDKRAVHDHYESRA
jgi:DNA-binding GntR family transcriptional regulator